MRRDAPSGVQPVPSPPAAATSQPLALNGAQTLVRLLEAEARAARSSASSAASSRRCCTRSRSSTIPFIGVRHEAAAPMMAAAVFASTGRVAVAMGEMGPGGLNLASGAGVAFNNNLAALLITTNQHRAAAYPHAACSWTWTRAPCWRR